MNDNTKKTVIVILIAIILALIAYSYISHNKQVENIDALKNEKNIILTELADLEEQFNEAITENTQLTEELETQKNSIVKFKDSLKNLKNTNWKLITFYKKKIKSLTVTTEKILAVNDSLVKRNNLLNQENQGLYEDKQALTTNLKSQTKYNDKLLDQNLGLAKKVALGEVIQITSYAIATYDERRSGKFKVSEKARRVNIFKVSFVVAKNPIATNKDINVYVTIIQPNGEILTPKGNFNIDNNRISFSETTIIPYKKEKLMTDIIIKTSDKLEKGIYTINIYIDGKKTILTKTLD